MVFFALQIEYLRMLQKRKTFQSTQIQFLRNPDTRLMLMYPTSQDVFLMAVGRVSGTS